MSEDVRHQALDYLQSHHVLTLATYGPEGVWAAAVFYASEEFRLTFLSAAHTRHAQNIAANPQVAATIQEDYHDWPAIKGVQLEGAVSLLEGVAREKAITHYRQKYTFLATAEASIQQALTRVNWYTLIPERLYFIDNSKGFAHRDEIIL